MFHRRFTLRSQRRSLLAASILLGFFAAPLHAENGSASAADVAVHVNVLGVAQLDVEPQAPVGFDNAVDAVHQQDALPTFDTGGALIHVSTGPLSVEAEYDPGTSFAGAGADVTIQNFDLSVLSLLGDGLLSLGADTIRSTSVVTGYCVPVQRTFDMDDITFYNGFDAGNLDPGGPGDDDKNVVLDNMHLSVLGTEIPALPVNPPPNTAIDLAAVGVIGATLTLNEQTLSGDGILWSWIGRNAVHLSLDSIGLLTADVVLGHSESKLACP